MIPDYRSRRAMPSLWAILVLAGCCAASMVITYRARAAQADADKPAATATQAPASSKDAPKDASSKDAPAKDAPAKERPAPSKAEESATIEDDPTLVPDSKESADNNVTFPIDI